ncbi:hypothetical protein [Haliangium sp.]|uniref:hypothetical protein n=1 Tax=Haliangium sp. TaxID=2663208 RepID=UPI003D106B0A
MSLSPVHFSSPHHAVAPPHVLAQIAAWTTPVTNAEMKFMWSNDEIALDGIGTSPDRVPAVRAFGIGTSPGPVRCADEQDGIGTSPDRTKGKRSENEDGIGTSPDRERRQSKTAKRDGIGTSP